MERLTKLKPECFTDIIQAHLDMMMSDGTTVMEFVANKVPCTIDVFTQMLDKSITIDERECGLVGKTFDFNRTFSLPCFRSDSTSTGCSGAPGTLGLVKGIWTSSLGWSSPLSKLALSTLFYGPSSIWNLFRYEYDGNRNIVFFDDLQGETGLLHHHTLPSCVLGKRVDYIYGQNK